MRGSGEKGKCSSNHDPDPESSTLLHTRNKRTVKDTVDNSVFPKRSIFGENSKEKTGGEEEKGEMHLDSLNSIDVASQVRNKPNLRAIDVRIFWNIAKRDTSETITGGRLAYGSHGVNEEEGEKKKGYAHLDARCVKCEM
ncbi:hypothetical protein PRIPAC_87152 [Pristionchus pacificus]|uniref:Uncharacterized protein n=1 Tax=Pristionchus pacificus TaxID=54126 RepID=A0A2A6B6L9_PRIPA|nr:hypothetical protein PRIPAC_87152 [Pristionchus pacificus]|eukprot:PDM61508.1 hypothetical protein PRIPAC_50950 [Pristionchus pacificus]